MSHRIRVLVIDDDPMFRSLLLSLLRKEYLVSVASDGSAGYYKALQHPPDVAIVDIQMPGWDGLTTLTEFRKYPALADVQVMMLTSDASRETVLAAIEAGANDYVIKTSFSKEEFYRKLDKLVADTPRGRALTADSDAADSAADEFTVDEFAANPSQTILAEGNTSDAASPIDLTPETVAVQAAGAQEVDAALQEVIDDWE